jgi:hypothetical protein
MVAGASDLHTHTSNQGKDTKTPSALNNLRKNNKISVEKRRLLDMGRAKKKKKDGVAI